MNLIMKWSLLQIMVLLDANSFISRTPNEIKKVNFTILAGSIVLQLPFFGVLV